jgi:hypothetical protein
MEQCGEWSGVEITLYSPSLVAVGETRTERGRAVTAAVVSLRGIMGRVT